MCGRFTLRTPASVLVSQFALDLGLQLPLRYNIAPTQQVAVIRSADGARQLAMMKWGLIPSWADDPKIGYSLINARSETVAEKPSFRSAMKSRRCLIPADGFFEWQKEGKKKLPIYFRRPDDQPFAFAGLWERWSKAAEPVESCTILTTSANALVRPFHDRMPVILSPNDYNAWLDPQTTDAEKLRYLFEPCHVEELTAYPVNPVVNSARHEGADCIEAV
jgi:putative SOS response-associated peptidase YedK